MEKVEIMAKTSKKKVAIEKLDEFLESSYVKDLLDFIENQFLENDIKVENEELLYYYAGVNNRKELINQQFSLIAQQFSGGGNTNLKIIAISQKELQVSPPDEQIIQKASTTLMNFVAFFMDEYIRDNDPDIKSFYAEYIELQKDINRDSQFILQKDIFPQHSIKYYEDQHNSIEDAPTLFWFEDFKAKIKPLYQLLLDQEFILENPNFFLKIQNYDVPKTHRTVWKKDKTQLVFLIYRLCNDKYEYKRSSIPVIINKLFVNKSGGDISIDSLRSTISQIRDSIQKKSSLTPRLKQIQDLLDSI
ncbi:MAG: hypothetical protein V4608_05365 [Bacteroidota bacterium]